MVELATGCDFINEVNAGSPYAPAFYASKDPKRLPGFAKVFRTLSPLLTSPYSLKFERTDNS